MKMTLMKHIISIVILMVSMQTTGYAEQLKEGEIPILMYHSIGNDPQNELVIPAERFMQEIAQLRQAGYTPIHFADLNQWSNVSHLPPKPIIITLDDGYQDNYAEGFPILKQFRMKATIFIVTEAVNTPNRLTWEQMGEMQRSGLVEFGAHTMHHVDLKKSSQKVQQEEIIGSKKKLEQKLSKPIIAFAYPSGQFSDTTVKEVQRAGFSYAVTTKPGWAKLTQGSFTLHRVRINGGMSLENFKRMFP